MILNSSAYSVPLCFKGFAEFVENVQGLNATSPIVTMGHYLRSVSNEYCSLRRFWPVLSCAQHTEGRNVGRG